MKSGIYIIENAVNGKQYAGSAVNLKRRWIDHRKRLRISNHHSIKLQNAWNKYGENRFHFRPILICDKKDLIFFEQRAIDALKVVTCGYNISPVAGSQMGLKHTSASIEKMREAHKGHIAWNLGLKLSDETRQNMSIAHIGKPSLKRGRKYGPLSPEHRVKVSEALKGRKKSPEHGAKISAAKMGHIVTDETRAKISKAGKGRKLTKEHRTKLKEAWELR